MVRNMSSTNHHEQAETIPSLHDGRLTGIAVETGGQLERLFPSPHPSAATTYYERHAEFLGGVLERIADGRATMVIVHSSYGYDLVAICGDAKLTMLGG
jgi:hypothetical protein